ncbi:glycosyltransferase [Nocardia sp. NPDC051570]|uniref:glycosyltransferase n=1 Tax=Nocardia sp. NPDC051570 TaxID=3364324 RepID=UPI0037B2F3DC
MTSTAISVVIPAHVHTAAGVAYLDEQLHALADQDYPGPMEVIVADNGSPIDLRTHLARSPLRARLDLRYADASATRGASHARNAGADQATGEILLFCDHDDRVYPDWASSLIAFLDNGYDIVSSAVEGSTLNTANPRKAAEIPAPDQFQPQGVVAPTLVGCSMACRTEAYRALGGLDITYAANEDVEFGWRASLSGYRVGYLPTALVAYRYRTEFRAGYRQGRARGIGLARLHAEFPGNGLPAIRFPLLLLTLAVLTINPCLVREERGLLMGITVGQLTGGLRHRTLLWR